MDDLQTTLHASLARLFSELVDGPPTRWAFMLNGGDPGLVRSLGRLSADAASRIPPGGTASIAAHVDHVCYGLDLMNRWVAGEENPWATADWTASWRRTTVDEEGWAALRARLAEAARRWHDALGTPRPLPPLAMNGVIGSIAHLAYHLGAIRQIDRATRGPSAEEVTT